MIFPNDFAHQTRFMFLANLGAMVHHLAEIASVLRRSPHIEPWVLDKMGRTAGEIEGVWRGLVGRATVEECQSVEMAKASLRAMVHHLCEIVAAVRSGGSVEPWMADKAARASENVSALWVFLTRYERENAKLNESRAGSAVRLDEIPAKYKGLKVLGRGTTTIALEKDADTVFLLTRDAMKIDWLHHIDMAKFVETISSSKNHIPGMNDIPITVMEMPKLEPLSPENAKLVRKVVKEFDAVHAKARSGAWKRGGFDNALVAERIFAHFSGREKHLLSPLWPFLMNYLSDQYHFDLGPRNFMQTRDGEIVVLDPVVSSEIMGLIRGNLERRARAA